MNMKKITALFMSAIMLFSSANLVFAENTEVTADLTAPPKAEILDTDEFRALYAMGFVGVEMTEAEKDSLITRALFTGYLFKLSGYPLTEYKTADIPFTDVSLETPYCSEICTMYEKGIVNGTDPGKFSPDAHITYAQACKLIVDVLGYRNHVALKYGEYPEGYVA
ncbi:MAG: S-layer homology domain-containing protein, partial [Clostridia bacterium]|nr:S-layer homology domain-containing protein [Clostridia bacterium]